MNIIREKLQKLFQKEIFYIVFSIIASIALWTYVAYVDNPEIDAQRSRIPIEFINEDVLTGKNLIATRYSSETATITFAGNRSAVRKILSADLKLSVDLSKILELGGTPGSYQLPYDIEYPNGVSSNGVETKNDSGGYVTVVVENLVSKEIPVRGMYDGEITEGYRAEPMEFMPEMITITGPESEVATVECAWAVVKRDIISSTVEVDTAFSLLDADGNSIVSDKLTLSTDTVRVRIPVVVVKEVSLDVNLVYGASTTDKNVIYAVSPSSVTLSGDVDILGDTNKLTLGTIDLTSFAISTTLEMPIVLPNSVENASGVTTALVTVQILDVETTKVTTTNIELKNETEGKTQQIVTQSLEVTLRGTGTSAEQVKPENVRVVADLAELGDAEGTFSVPAKVYIDGTTTVDAIGDYKITVNVGA